MVSYSFIRNNVRTQRERRGKKMIRGGKGRERDKTKTKQAEETGKVRNTKRGGEAEANC